MKIMKEVISQTIVGYKCDICGKYIDISLQDDLRLIDLSGNTESGNYRECDMCESCFAKVEKFITETLGGVLNEV